MIKHYKIKGLDCPNCAKKLEEDLKKVDGVKSLSINFLKNELAIDCKNDDVEQNVLKIAKKIEPNISFDFISYKIKDKTSCCEGCFCCDCHKHHDSHSGVLLFVIGSVLGVLCLFIKQYSSFLFYILLVLSTILIGYKTFFTAIRQLLNKTINENFLVSISVVGAILIGKEIESLMVIFLYTIGKFLESIALEKSKKSIEKLTNFRPEFARIILPDSKEKVCKPSEVKVGDIILVKPGERIPLDGTIVSGKANLNMQSLTGESLPVLSQENNDVLSGSIVIDGVLKIKVTTLYKDSCVNKILNLIEEASEKKSKTETFVSKVAKWYTLGVLVCSIFVFGLVFLLTNNLSMSLYRGMIFLVVSCPCAFAISVPLSYFSGLGRASKSGILIKGSNFVDMCAKIKTIGFDKTGTITTGKFEIKDIKVVDKNFKKEDILYLASLGEQYSLHPLAKCIVEKNTFPLVEVEDLREIVGKGVKFLFKNDLYFVGNDKEVDSDKTAVFLYKNKKLIGEIYFEDKIKDNVRETILKLKDMGIRTLLISGDKESVVRKIGKEINIDECYFSLLPQDKFDLIKKFCKTNTSNKFAFVGDGLNDAPGLNLCDVGFCMGINGSDASIEGCDVIIVDDDISKIVECIKISKFTRKIVLENIFGSAIIKLTFLLLGAFGVTGMLGAVVADVGLTLVAIANSLRVLTLK